MFNIINTCFDFVIADIILQYYYSDMAQNYRSKLKLNMTMSTQPEKLDTRHAMIH